jgi:hypothetical protein
MKKNKKQEFPHFSDYLNHSRELMVFLESLINRDYQKKSLDDNTETYVSISNFIKNDSTVFCPADIFVKSKMPNKKELDTDVSIVINLFRRFLLTQIYESDLKKLALKRIYYYFLLVNSHDYLVGSFALRNKDAFWNATSSKGVLVSVIKNKLAEEILVKSKNKNITIYVKEVLIRYNESSEIYKKFFEFKKSYEAPV